MANFIYILILAFGTISLIRIAIMLIATDWYDINESLKPKSITATSKSWPRISIIVPAYNESLAITRCLASILSNQYPNYEVIVVDDGSKDNTSSLVRRYIQETNTTKVRLITQANAGKAAALNNAMKTHAKGSLVMCLDADSMLAADAIYEAAHLFRENPDIIAMASNVHVVNTSGLLGLAQVFEYLLSYRTKRALTALNMEYIIGGVGSTFRKSALKSVNYYDHDTMTEDIDLTLKLATLGNKKNRLVIGPKVHTYTEGVLSFGDLVKQRYRWKYGRMQTLYKNRKLLLNTDKKYTKALTFYQLPYAIFGEINLLLEPLFIGLIVFGAVVSGNYFSLQWIFVIISVYMLVNIIGIDSLPRAEKIKLALLAPVGYCMFYLLSLVEFIALVKSLVRLPRIAKSLDGNASKWEHVERLALN